MNSLVKRASRIPGRVLRKIRSLQYKDLLARNTVHIQLKIHKLPFWINVQDQVLGRHFYIYRDYENFETGLIERLLSHDMTVIDIGANIGFHSVICGRRVSNGRVIAFEPDPNNFDLLRKNIELNRLRNVHTEQLAVMDRDDEIYLYLSDLNFGDHRTFEPTDDALSNQGQARTKVPVKGTSIDKYVKASNLRPDLIKMDIQGAEIPALIGMEETLREFMPIIFCEYWPHGLRQSGFQPEEFLQRLTNLEYELFEIREQSRTLGKVSSSEELTSRLVEEASKSVDAHVNLLCIPVRNADKLSLLSGLM